MASKPLKPSHVPQEMEPVEIDPFGDEVFFAFSPDAEDFVGETVSAVAGMLD